MIALRIALPRGFSGRGAGGGAWCVRAVVLVQLVLVFVVIPAATVFVALPAAVARAGAVAVA